MLFRSVTTENHKLVLCDDGDGELYDLAEEPREVNNRFRDPALREVRRELTGKLALRLLADGRVRRFGGGRHPDDEGRKKAFAEISRRIRNGEFPGLKTGTGEERT